MRKYLLTLITLSALTWSNAQEPPVTPSLVKNGQFLGVSAPLKDLPVVTEEEYRQMEARADARLLNPKLEIREYPYAASALPQGPDEVWQKSKSAGDSKAPLVNFEAQSSSSYPPDCNGTAGPNHYMQTVNATYAIYDKTGALLAGPTAMNQLFSGVPGSNCNSGDPLILYDEDADRWLAVEFSLCGSNDMMLVAVSTTNDPTGTWYKYSFDVDDTPDYEKFGIWPDGYYMGVNNSPGEDIYAFERSVMLTGGANPQMIAFDNPWRPSSVDGFMCVPPVDNDGTPAPAGSPGLFIAFNDDAIGGGSDELWIYELAANWSSPASSTFNRTQQIPVAAFDANFGNNWNNIKQPGTSQELDGVPQVIMHVPQYRNFGSYQTIVCCHTVDVDATDHAGIRWYELRRTSGNWSVRQQGTYAPDEHSRWMGSVMLNGSGEIGLGYSISSTTIYPGIRYAGQTSENYQLANGILDFPEGVIMEASSSQTGVNRWGDYALMSVDPADDETFWFTTQYAGPNGSRKTRVAAFQVGLLAPQADFLASTTLPCINNVVTFTDQSSGSPFSWLWSISPDTFEYMDGTDSTSQNPHIRFTAYGNYDVSLTATNAGGSNTESKSAFISVNAVNAQFTANATTVVIDNSIVFSDLSSCNVGSWLWDFGAGANPPSANTPGPHLVTYSSTGLKTVTLTLNDTVVETKVNYVNVIEPSINMTSASISTCTADFFDPGGSGSNYSSNLDHVMVVYPGVPGNNIQVNFSSFNLESGMFCANDYLKIINGDELTDPAFGVYCGTNNPGVLTASNPEGAITFVFHSNNIVTYPGWVATLNCVSGIANPLSLVAEVLGPASIQLNWTMNSSNDPVLLAWSADGVFGSPQNNATYNPGDMLPGGGTVLYFGNLMQYLHESLSPETIYHYKAFSNSSTGEWSAGISTSAATLPIPSLLIDPVNQTVSFQSGESSFNVISNSAWTVQSDASWCTATATGFGNGVIVASHDQNDGPVHRIANLVVTVEGLAPVVLTLTQLPSFVGIEENTLSKMLLYPNPSAGIVTIMSTNNSKFDVDITITDSSGKTFINSSCKGSGFYTFDLSNKSAGQYIVKATTNAGTVNWKLMLK